MNFAGILALSAWKDIFLLHRNRQLVLDSYAHVTVSDSTFFDITSDDNGGAIKCIRDDTTSELYLERLFIQNCHSSLNGGAICAVCGLCSISKVCGYKCTAGGIGQFYAAETNIINERNINNLCSDSSFSHADNSIGERSLSNNYGIIGLTGVNLSFVNCREFSFLQVSPTVYSVIQYSSFSNSTASVNGFFYLSDTFANNLFEGNQVNYVNFLSNTQLDKSTTQYFALTYVSGPSQFSYSNFMLNDVSKIFAQTRGILENDAATISSTFMSCYIDSSMGFFYTGEITPVVDNVYAENHFKVEFLRTAKCELLADYTINGFFGKLRHITCNPKRKFVNFVPQFSLIAVCAK